MKRANSQIIPIILLIFRCAFLDKIDQMELHEIVYNPNPSRVLGYLCGFLPCAI